MSDNALLTIIISASCVVPHREFASLIQSLPIHRTRLVWLYAQAIRLEQDGHNHVCDRLQAVETIFHVTLTGARRRTRIGPFDEEELSVLEAHFGISRQWMLDGDLKALKKRLREFCESESEDRSEGED